VSPGLDDRDYDIISLGADGQEGGEGFDADITSWSVEN
jgi:general secretion pathway protein G